MHDALEEFGYETKFVTNTSYLNEIPYCKVRLKFVKLFYKLKLRLSFYLSKLQSNENYTIHSLSLFSNRSLLNYINNSNADIVNLHWVQGEMLSIEDIDKIKKPVVWTLHDMWLFCGSEHYTNNFRWKYSYDKRTLPISHKGLDLDRFVSQRKFKSWKIARNLVTPSYWLKTCANESSLCHNWPCENIPNPISEKIFYKKNKLIIKKEVWL